MFFEATCSIKVSCHLDRNIGAPKFRVLWFFAFSLFEKGYNYYVFSKTTMRCKCEVKIHLPLFWLHTGLWKTMNYYRMSILLKRITLKCLIPFLQSVCNKSKVYCSIAYLLGLHLANNSISTKWIEICRADKYITNLIFLSGRLMIWLAIEVSEPQTVWLPRSVKFFHITLCRNFVLDQTLYMIGPYP